MNYYINSIKNLLKSILFKIFIKNFKPYYKNFNFFYICLFFGNIKYDLSNKLIHKMLIQL